MKVNSNLVWIKGIARNVDEEEFEKAFAGLTYSFDKTVAYIKENKPPRDNKFADKLNKILNINMVGLDYRMFFQLCHSYVYPTLCPQRILFNPHLYHRLVGRVYNPNTFYFNRHYIHFEWEPPEEYNEVNILPTEILALDYTQSEKGVKTWYISRLCDELECDNIQSVSDWFAGSVKGIKKRKKTYEKFSWTPKEGIQ